jgi:hypothetical protein
MNNGYIRIWRKTIESGWLKNHQLWVFWSWCLLKATYKEYDAIVGFQQVHLVPGQFIFGRRQAAIETGLSERQIRTSIDLLKTAQNLTIKTTNKFSIVSIINWDTYQGNGIQNDQQNDQQPTSNRPHTNIKEYILEKRVSKTGSPEKFPVTDKMKEYANGKGYSGDLNALTEKFINYHRAKGSKFSSWEAAWRNWLLNELKFHPQTNAPVNGGRTLEDILS